MNILVYSERQSPRLRYVLDHIFGAYFNEHYHLTSSKEEFNSFVGPKLSYGSTLGTLCIKRASIIDEPFDHQLEIDKHISIEASNLFDFSSLDNYSFDFDIFSAAFFLLSRYEEYLPTKRDEHDRFLADASILSNTDLTDPPIDRWLLALKTKIEDIYPTYTLNYKNKYEIIATMDIDHYYDLKYKPWYLKVAKTLNSLRKGEFEEFNIRRKAANGEADLFDHFDTFEEICKGVKKKYFLHLGKASKYDESHPIDPKAIRETLAKITTIEGSIGIHPSYLSNQDDEALDLEWNRYKKYVGNDPILSRQHFLKLTLPTTYRKLISKGIKEDYSLSYAGQIGFRAGTAHPFYWYDLLNEQATTLKIFPNALMDVTLQQYMALDIPGAIAAADKLKAICKKYSAPYQFIWHNISMTDLGAWKGWNEVLERLIN